MVSKTVSAGDQPVVTEQIGLAVGGSGNVGISSPTDSVSIQEQIKGQALSTILVQNRKIRPENSSQKSIAEGSQNVRNI